jgi:hypothetical protein
LLFLQKAIEIKSLGTLYIIVNMRRDLMKKLISGMFSSVPDAQLLLATTGYDEVAPENATDKLSDNGRDNSQTRTEVTSSIVSNTTTNEASDREAMNKALDDSLP